MKTITTKQELAHEIALLKMRNLTIGFVPTMGALHDGHTALVNRSVTENGACVVSVFVNPTQFDNAVDLEKYPRDLSRDEKKLRQVGCSLLFAPSVEEMYEPEETERPFDFDFGGLDQVMEGRYRPGHFNGVVQVVSKLFTLVQPDRAYFGEKDFQQLAIIRRMVNLMKFPVEIVSCPTVREAGGLALSSRNERLSDEERKKAVKISEFLFKSRTFAPLRTITEVTHWVVDQVNKVDGLKVEYFEIVDAATLQPAVGWEGDRVGCIAVYCGRVRLIDNVHYPRPLPRGSKTELS